MSKKIVSIVVLVFGLLSFSGCAEAAEHSSDSIAQETSAQIEQSPGVRLSATNVYRFWSDIFRGHFFTIDEDEYRRVRDTDINWSYESVAFGAYESQEEDTVPVYRFWSDVFRGHFFTIDETEYKRVKDTDTNWSYEGIAYYVYSVDYNGPVETEVVYRFWSPVFLHHFYTSDYDEMVRVRDTDSNWTYEGEAYRVPVIVKKDDGDQSRYSIEQAISDHAQETTIAFDALAFFTGNTCADSFLPPGKVADFFGYQYLRDTTQAGQGHSTDFVTNSANNVLYILNDDQVQQMIDLAKSQVSLVNQYAYDRYPLMVAFRRQLEGDIPAGSSGLDKQAVIDYSEDLYLLDAEISMQRAELFGDIIRSLDGRQRQFLDDMVVGGFESWEPREDQIDKQSLSHDEHVLVMTYASEMFGWYAGDVEADTYFCPERHGTYFGSFYMKDAPAMGQPGYVIDEQVTGEKGEKLLESLTSSQAKLVTDLVDIQKDNLYGIVDSREAISTELRKYLVQDSIDENLVLALARTYGAQDGENVYYYATHFAEVMETLTDQQLQDLMVLRDLDDFPCSEGDIYVYSERISRPQIEDTNFLFGV